MNIVAKQIEIPQFDDTHQVATNHILIGDHSGSMGWAITTLAADIIRYVTEVPDGDYVTIGWFSSPRQFGWVVVNHLLTPNRMDLYAMIQKNAYTRGTTCFSDILAAISDVLAQTPPSVGTHVLAFLTDGCPVVPDRNREEVAVRMALAGIKDKLSGALWLAYGNYADIKMLTLMAAASGGSIVAIDDVRKMAETTKANITPGQPATQVVIGGGKQAFCISGDGTPTSLVNYKGTVNVPPSAKQLWEYHQGDGAVVPAEVYYALALIAMDANDLPSAAEHLSTYGDVQLTNQVLTAFTVSDYANASTAIRERIANPTTRPTSINPGYKPQDDAPCLLDVIEQLQADPEAKFYPGDSRFSYTAIGRKRIKRDGQAEFTNDVSAACAMDTLTWNSEKLNLSVQLRIPGTVVLPNDYPTDLFDSPIIPNMQRWANYAIIRDGQPNVKILPCSMSEHTWTALRGYGVVDEPTWNASTVYAVHTDRIPVVNKEIAKGYDLNRILDAALNDMALAAQLKILNNLQETRFGKPKMEDDRFTTEQIVYLEGVGVGRNGYSPKSDEAPATDHYMARTFEIKVAGMSSLPSIAEVKSRIASGKAQTASGQVLANALATMDAGWNTCDETTLQSGIRETRRLKREAGNIMARAKFAARIAGQPIAGLKFAETGEANEVAASATYGGYTVSFVMGEEKVEF